jgi:hypothetical protein
MGVSASVGVICSTRTCNRLLGSGKAKTPGTGSLTRAERSRVRRCKVCGGARNWDGEKAATLMHSFLGMTRDAKGSQCVRVYGESGLKTERPGTANAFLQRLDDYFRSACQLVEVARAWRAQGGKGGGARRREGHVIKANVAAAFQFKKCRLALSAG